MSEGLIILFFFLRRIMMAATFTLSTTPYYQILILILISNIKLGLTFIIKPYETQKQANLDLFNDLCITLTMYGLLTFTE